MSTRQERQDLSEEVVETLIISRMRDRKEYLNTPEGKAKEAELDNLSRKLLIKGTEDFEVGGGFTPKNTIAGVSVTYIGHKEALNLNSRPSCSLCGGRVVDFYRSISDVICMRCAKELGK